jgi:hypothetical protein
MNKLKVLEYVASALVIGDLIIVTNGLLTIHVLCLYKLVTCVVWAMFAHGTKQSGLMVMNYSIGAYLIYKSIVNYNLLDIISTLV